MRLHEYYFNNMTKDYVELDRNSNLYGKIVEDFESYENWEKEFKAVGMIRGIGWTILYNRGKQKISRNNEEDGLHQEYAVHIQE